MNTGAEYKKDRADWVIPLVQQMETPDLGLNMLSNLSDKGIVIQPDSKTGKVNMYQVVVEDMPVAKKS